MSDLAAMRARLAAAGAPIGEDVPLPGRLRFETRDPFGNRLEFQQLLLRRRRRAAPTRRPARRMRSCGRPSRRTRRPTSAANPRRRRRSGATGGAGGAAASDLALDVSTGGGHTALALAPQPRARGGQRSDAAHAGGGPRTSHAQGATNVDYVIADAERLPFLDESFDLVTVRIAPHHYPDVARAAQEMARVLKPGGRLVVIDNIAPEEPALDAALNDWERRRDPSHIRSHTLAAWREFIAQAGLRLTHAEVGRKRIAFAPWAERTQMPAADQAALEADMLAAPAEAQTYFEITRSDDGRLASWTMEYAVLRAERVG